MDGRNGWQHAGSAEDSKDRHNDGAGFSASGRLGGGPG